MVREVLNINILDKKRNWYKFKDLCSKNRHKSYTHRYVECDDATMRIDISGDLTNKNINKLMFSGLRLITTCKFYCIDQT